LVFVCVCGVCVCVFLCVSLFVCVVHRHAGCKYH